MMKEHVERVVKTSEATLQSKLDIIEGKLLAEIKILQERRRWW